MDLGSLLGGVLSPLIGGGQAPQAPQAGQPQQQPYGITPLGQAVLSAYLGGVGTSKHKGIGDVISNAGFAGLNAYNQANQAQSLGAYRGAEESRLNAQAKLEQEKAQHEQEQQKAVGSMIDQIDLLPGLTDQQRLDRKLGAVTGHYPPTTDGLSAYQKLEESHTKFNEEMAQRKEQREELDSRQAREAKSAALAKDAQQKEIEIEKLAQAALKNRGMISKLRDWGSTTDAQFVENYKNDLRQQMGGAKAPDVKKDSTSVLDAMSTHGAAPTNAVYSFLKDHGI